MSDEMDALEDVGRQAGTHGQRCIQDIVFSWEP